MQHSPAVPTDFLNAEDRAFFARLTALNSAFEAARAGRGAQLFAERATSIDALLDRYFIALTGQPADTDHQ